MAIANTKGTVHQAKVKAPLFVTEYSFAVSGTYVAGGWPVDLSAIADLPGHTIVAMIIEDDATYHYVWDASAQKIMARDAADNAESSGTIAATINAVVFSI